jgi:hypothetical protein
MMPEGTLRERIETILSKSAADVAKQITEVFADAMREAVGGEVSVARKPVDGRGARGKPAKRAAGRRSPKAELTRWVPDASARRVPKFVIKMTGLDTKMKIVEKYGDKVVFEIGKPPPKPAK